MFSDHSHLAQSDDCPCGGTFFGSCCSPFVLDGVPASNPEVLMRSRYTAYAIRNEAHLLRTWHPRTRPRRIGGLTDTTWTSLTIVDAPEPDGDTGFVTFIARYRHSFQADGALEEKSEFTRRGSRWVYVGPAQEPSDD